MCGIVGLLGRRAVSREDVQVINELTHLMRRRGPDDEGLWSDHHAVLGFRRLAIIDPSSAGHQPMESSDGRFVLVFNGEIYNFRALRAELEVAEVKFRSSSDSEVVLKSLMHWGDEALKRFNGIFALGFYDRLERHMLLARDPVGVKPLYYMANDRGVVFASQFDQIVRHPWSRRTIDIDALQLYLRFGHVPAPWALTKDASMLPPGHVVSVRAGEASAPSRYYAWPVSDDRLTGGEAMEVTAAAVAAAVKRQLVSDVPLGVFLSGGIDSPLVAGTAAVASRDPLDAFTVGSDDPRMDESDAATALASALGLNHVSTRAGSLDAIALLERHAAAYSEPFADHSSIPTLLVSEMARERVTVALSGDGGDELYFGYPRFRRVLRTRRLFRAPRLARVGRYALGRAQIAPRVPPGTRFETIGDWYLDSHSYWHQGQLELVAPDLACLPEEYELYRSPLRPSEDELAQWLRRVELEGHLQRILLKVDRASMHHHLEVRVPLLDLEVVSAAMRTSPAACMTDRGDKAILRTLLSRRVDGLATGDKRGFTVPVGEWLRTSLRGHIEDLLLSRDPEPAGVFDRTELRAMYNQHRQGVDHTLPLFALLALQLWWHTHYVRSSG